MYERFKTFTVLITKINRNIHKIKTEEMAEFNLKGPHVSCLYYLYKSKSLTAKELRGICGEDKASISRSIDYLEKNGYIECNSETKKRYNAELKLTEKGCDAGEKIAVKIDNILNVIGDGLSDENRTVLYQSLELINYNLQEFCDKYGE